VLNRIVALALLGSSLLLAASPAHLPALSQAVLKSTALAAATAPVAAADQDRPVLAYYYVWWDPSVFARTLFQPAQPYNSDDPATIQRHLQQAQSAGIDGFVVSWYGNGDRTDANLARLLDLAAPSGFSATVDFETDHFWGVDDVLAQLQALYAGRLNHPAMLRYQGRPVIFFWRAGAYPNDTWSAIRAQVDPNHTAVWIADGDNFAILGGDAWDGISPYAIAWSGNPGAQLASWGARARATAPDKLWVPPVSPGCNDSAARAPTCVRDRGDGSYFQATWDGAVASNPGWGVVVSTFNEWLEATQIEPAVQYGDQYLQLTRQNADGFHSQPVGG
jgi:hypothetical protein